RVGARYMPVSIRTQRHANAPKIAVTDGTHADIDAAHPITLGRADIEHVVVVRLPCKNGFGCHWCFRARSRKRSGRATGEGTACDAGAGEIDSCNPDSQGEL